MQVSNSRVLIFPILTDPTTSSKTILALKNNNQILPLSGSINPTDPNSTYAATRILFKEFFMREFKDSLEAIAEQGSNSWMDETFRHWLIKFVDADFYDIPEERTYIYIVPVDNDIQNLNSNQIAKLSEEDLKTYCPEEYKEYARARDFYQEIEQTGKIQYYGVLNCETSEPWKNHYEALYSGILREKGEKWLNPFTTSLSKKKFQNFRGNDSLFDQRSTQKLFFQRSRLSLILMHGSELESLKIQSIVRRNLKKQKTFFGIFFLIIFSIFWFKRKKISRNFFCQIFEKKFEKSRSPEQIRTIPIPDLMVQFKSKVIFNCNVQIWDTFIFQKSSKFAILPISGTAHRGRVNYTAVDSRLPTDSELAKLRGLVISGANHASYDDTPFHAVLYKVLQKAFYEYPQLKLLGVCFGHQVLAHCLGGKAEKMQGLPVPFMTNLELVQTKPELKQKSYYKKTLEKLGIADVENFVAVEAHGDHVAALPEKAEILGNSEMTSVEMWGLDEKIFCTQFHPEFNEGLMKLKLLQEITYEEAVNTKMMKRFLDSEKNLSLDRTFQITLCKNFIKN